MQAGYRFIVGLLAALLMASACGQAIIWERSVPDSSQGLLVRDSSSNLYFATRTSFFGGSRLHVQKYNSNGVLLWQNVRTFNLGTTWTWDTQISLRAINLTSSRVVVMFHSRRDGGAGAFVRSFLYGFDRGNGALTLSGSDWDSEWEHLAINGNTVARAKRVIASGDGVIDFFAADTFVQTGSANFFSVASINDLTLDESGFA